MQPSSVEHRKGWQHRLITISCIQDFGRVDLCGHERGLSLLSAVCTQWHD